jgi:site-specific DNA-methyltransferase (adenine-specific)
VSQAKRVSNEAPDLAEAVRRGDVTLDNAEKQLKRRKAQEAEADAREAVIVATPSDAQGDGWRLFNGDFRERLHEIEPGSVDLIISDPPYPAESLPLWSDLAQVAAKLLKPQGVLVALTGQIYLPEVLARLGEHLTYGWTYCQPLPGQQSRIMGRHVMQSWKPWVTFTNGQWPSGRIDWHPDMLDPSYRAKDQYRWQQDPNPTLLLIDALSDEGSLIVDPFTGTGSYGIAALQMGRKFIGVELDSDRFNGAAERLAAKETE